MRQINIAEARKQLSRIIAAGKEVVIVRYGKPVARLLPIKTPTAKRVPGSARGKFKVSPEFFDPLHDDIIDSFEKETIT